MSKNKDRFTIENNDLGTERQVEIPGEDTVGRTDSPFSKPDFLAFDDQPFPDEQINID